MTHEYKCKSFQLTTSMIMPWPARIGSQYVTAKTVRSFTLGRSMIGEATGWCSCIEKAESCSLDMPEDVTWYSGSLSNLCRECPD